MKQPLDLERPRGQLCPICHDHGYVQDDVRLVPCTNLDCGEGRAYRDTLEARARLSDLYSPRDVDLWMQSHIRALGGRPLNLIREGRGDDVLAAIERIPGIPPRDVLPEPAEAVCTPQKSPEARPDPAAVRRVLAAQLRQRGERRIADALEAGNVSSLTDREQALLDAAMTGQGYLVNGKRVDPDEVEIFRWS